MNSYKLQNQLLKDFLNEKTSRWDLGQYKEQEAIVLDGTAVYLIPQDTYLLDHELFNHFTSKGDYDIAKLIETNKSIDYETATVTPIMYRLGRTICVKLKGSENNYAWADNKYLAYFDNNVSYRICCNSKQQMLIRVYEDGALAGLVLPVRNSLFNTGVDADAKA